jgi:chondroitin AC lyase
MFAKALVAVSVAALVLLPSCKADVPSDADLQTIFMRIAQTNKVTQAVEQFDAQLAYNLTFVTPEYTFSDLNYSYSSPAWWYAEFHAKRTLECAIAYTSPASSFYQNASLLQTTLGLFNWWLVHNPVQEGNWWYNDIGTPDNVGRTAIVLEAAGVQLSANQSAAVLNIIYRAFAQGCSSPDANCIWLSTNQMLYALLTNNVTIVNKTVSAMWATVQVQPGTQEGIKADGSFLMHGELMYSGGYGMSYTAGIIHLLAWTAGTKYFLPDPNQLLVFSNFLIDGSFRLIHYGKGQEPYGPPMWSFAAIGRDISRCYGSDWFFQAGQAVAFDPEAVANIGGPRADELVAFAALLNGTATPEQAALPTGNTVFYISDVVTHTRLTWMADLHMSSTRTLRSECINGENLQGNHLGEGTSFLMQSGYEYANIMPAWDWRLLPGATADPSAPLSCGDVGGFGMTKFVGAASDGTVGMSAFDFVSPKYTNVSFRKATAFFTNALVYLGANLTNGVPNGQLWTGIEQRILAAPYTPGQPLASTDVYTAASPSAPLAPGSVQLDNSAWWVWEGNTGYIFPDLFAGNATYTAWVKAVAASGNWSAVGAQSGQVDLAVFSLWLEHALPAVGRSFSVIVVPSIDLASFSSNAKGYLSDLIVVRNDPDAQAVQQVSTSTLAAAVYASSGATVAAPGKFGSATFASAGAYIMSASGNNATLAASNPAQTSWQLQATVQSAFAPSTQPNGAQCIGNGGWSMAAPPATGASAVITCQMSTA